MLAIIFILLTLNIIFSYMLLRKQRKTNNKSSQAQPVAVPLKTEMNDNTLEIAGVIEDLIILSSSSSLHSQYVNSIMNDFHVKVTEAADYYAVVNKQIIDLQKGIFKNADDMNQTGAAIEEITASIGSISNESQARYRELSGIVDMMESGKKEMEVTKQIINNTTAGIGSLLDFIKMIDEIASRTSILSMNAAIQAAHAGEAGKGFAVVAHEVRRLAQTTSQNASNITQKLKSLIESIKLAEESSDKTVDILNMTGEKLKITADSFTVIEEGTKELFAASRDIMSSTISINDTGRSILKNSEAIALSSKSIIEKLDFINSEALELSSQEDMNHSNICELNFNILSLAQFQIKKLEGSGSKDKAPLFVLYILTALGKIRSLIDDKIKFDGQYLFKNDPVEKWLSQYGEPKDSLLKEIKDKHKKMQSICLDIISLCKSGNSSKTVELFKELTELTEHELKIIKKFLSENNDDIVLYWTDSLSVKNKHIDEQHKKLVNMVNKLNSAVNKGESRNMLGTILDELIEYTVKHFKDEEALFVNSSYPGKEKHLEEHNNLKKTVSELRAAFMEGNVLIGTDTIDFLKNWLVNHIMGTDMEYTSYIK